MKWVASGGTGSMTSFLAGIFLNSLSWAQFKVYSEGGCRGAQASEKECDVSRDFPSACLFLSLSLPALLSLAPNTQSLLPPAAC